MSKPRKAKASSESACVHVHRPGLLEAMRQCLPLSSLGQLCRGGWAWTPEVLIVAAMLMAWHGARTLSERFEAVRDSLVEMFAGQRIGRTYQGWIKALLPRSSCLLAQLGDFLREQLPAWAGPYWTREGCLAFAVDGSRVETPRTAANEKQLGCAGKNRTTPQLFLTMLYHMGTGLPWDFQVGPGTDSERTQLQGMLWRLPPSALIVADAGFVGYQLLRTITRTGRSFLIRVGRNVRLLRQLGYAQPQQDGTVYLWPQRQRREGQPPLVLRLMRFHNGRHPVFLVSNVLDPAELSEQQASILYRMRWGVELFFRCMKQTLARRKMCSGCPANARCELQWTVLGLWVLGRIGAEQIIRRGRDPLSFSVALARRRVRMALRQIGRSPPGPAWAEQLGECVKDRYAREKGKKARNWPHKKTERPPGAPQISLATPEEIRNAQALDNHNLAT